jgi:hypothetical protein
MSTVATLENRISRLEKALMKKEFLDFDKLTSGDETEFIDKLFSKYRSLANILSISDTVDKSDTFSIKLYTDKNGPYNGLYFRILTSGGRRKVYITAYNDESQSNNKYKDLGVLRNLNIDTDIDKVAEFILSILDSNKNEVCHKHNKKQLRKSIKNENVPLTTFDCGAIKQAVEDYLDDLPEVKINVNDDNSDYGYIKVSLYNPKYLTDYEIIVSDSNSIKLIHKNKTVDTVGSIDDAVELLSKDFMKDYIDGKYRV